MGDIGVGTGEERHRGAEGDSGCETPSGGDPLRFLHELRDALARRDVGTPGHQAEELHRA
jgi:hypothetical protein